jgi:hypothetical protein
VASQKSYELDISLNGRLSPSVLAAISQTEAMLKRLNTSTKTFNAAMNAVYKEVFSGAQQATRQTDKLGESMRRIGQIGGGVSLGDMLSRGFQTGVDLIGQMVGGMKEMSLEAMKAAESFELLSKGMGAILRDQGFANQLLDSLQEVAYKSPFQLTDLGGVSRSLAGRGMGKGQLYGATTELGDITAGLGGGSEILDRLSLAYGEAFDQEAVDKKIMRQFTFAGVPMWDALLKAMGMGPNDHAKLEKMIHDKKVSFSDLDKAIYELTHDGGLFTDGMLNFSKTYRGILTTFEDMWGRFERDFGGIINDWVGALLQFVNSSGIWDEAHRWLMSMSEMSRSVLTFVQGLTVSFPAFDNLRTIFEGFNKWIGSFFELVMIPGQDPQHPGTDLKMVLNATGNEQIKMIVDNAAKMFNMIADFVTSKGVQDLANWSWGSMMTGMENLFNWLKEIIELGEDIKSGDWGKFFSDFGKYESAGMPVAPGDSGAGWSGQGGSRGGNYGLHGGLSGSGAYQSQVWDPILNATAAKYGIDPVVLKAIARQEGVAPGDFNPMGISPGGGGPTHYGSVEAGAAGIDAYVGAHLQHFKDVNSKNPSSVDDFARWYSPPGAGNDPYGTNSSEGSGIKSWMQRLNNTPPVTINYHINTLDSDGVHRVLMAHGETIKDHIQSLLAGDFERSAVV